jgi:hypothetical protein
LAASHNIRWSNRELGRKEEGNPKYKRKKKNLRKGWTKDAGHGDDETPHIIVILLPTPSCLL